MLTDDQLALGEKVLFTGKGPFPIFDSRCRGQMFKQKGCGGERNGDRLSYSKKRIEEKNIGKRNGKKSKTPRRERFDAHLSLWMYGICV